MLQVPDLDNITYEQLLENAIHKIPQLTKEWTDFNVHDPGITTLEIHAWLIDMLNYYINASGDVHTYKYMKLLGITPMKKNAARVFAMAECGASTECAIPKDFPVYAGNKCFVTAQRKGLLRNRLVGLYRQIDGTVVNLTDFVGKGDKYAKVFDSEFCSNESVYLKFERTLKGTVELFVTVKEQENSALIPEDFHLSVMDILSFDGTEWKSVKILRDGTSGLLKSGVICLAFEEEMRVFQQNELAGALLKIVLKENYFDTAPEIGEIYLNPIELIQKENVIRRLDYVLPAGEKQIKLQEYLANEEEIRIGRKDADSEWVMIAEGLYQIDKDTSTITFDTEFLSQQECQLDIFVINNEVLELLAIGITDGCANQEYELSVRNPYETELLIGTENNGYFRYTKWTYIDELEKASGREQVYTWDESTGVFRFGDGIHGMVPQEGAQVILSKLSVSDFEEGNVRAGEINGIRDERYAGICVNNFEAAAGGRYTETLEEMQKRLEMQVRTQKRLVAPSDYEEQIRKIPGLRIKAAKVIPASVYCRSHGLPTLPYDVWIVVCPEKQKRMNRLGRQYEEAILNWLEPYRILGTRIRVVAPVYTGIQISGKVRIQGNKVQAQKIIAEFLKDYIGTYEKNCEFGAVLSQGDIFMKLEALECVERVDELHLSPGGKFAERNDRGDVIMADDCLPYVGEIAFELINNFG